MDSCDDVPRNAVGRVFRVEADHGMMPVAVAPILEVAISGHNRAQDIALVEIVAGDILPPSVRFVDIDDAISLFRRGAAARRATERTFRNGRSPASKDIVFGIAVAGR